MEQPEEPHQPANVLWFSLPISQNLSDHLVDDTARIHGMRREFAAPLVVADMPPHMFEHSQVVAFEKIDHDSKLVLGALPFRKRLGGEASGLEGLKTLPSLLPLPFRLAALLCLQLFHFALESRKCLVEGQDWLPRCFFRVQNVTGESQRQAGHKNVPMGILLQQDVQMNSVGRIVTEQLAERSDAARQLFA
jgi:hypothetical protein